VTFATPAALWSLLVVPLAIVGYLWLQRMRRRDSDRFATAALLPNIVERVPGWRRHLPAALLLLAVTSFLFGFARPHANLSVRSEQATVVLAIDTSRSMGSNDVAPTRLAVAQATARRFIAGLPKKYRVAVIAFSTRAQVVSAPTTDRSFVSSAISDLRVGQGTALGDGLSNAVQIATGVRPGAPLPPVAKRVPASILILSDGAEDGGTVPLPKAIARARAARIPVYAGLIGTQEGVVSVKLVGGFIQRIRVPPNPKLLKQVANGTGGRFYTAPTTDQLKAVYRDLHSRLGHESKNEEITVAFAGLGVLLLLAGCAISLVWFRRIP
jgi:Ca-activated chloride channel family protein